MKKFLYFAFSIFALSLVLVGCEEKVTEEKIDVGVILPTEDETRWQQDKVQFEKLFKTHGLKGEILFSKGQASVEKENVQTLIDKGVKVIVICPHDGEEAAKSIEAAKYAGVKIISYDRLILNSDAVDYYVSFDSFEVGEKQAYYLIEHRPSNATNIPLYLYSGAISDNNSYQFFSGAWSSLQPYIEDGTFEIANSEVAKTFKSKKELEKEDALKIMKDITTNWDESVARNLAKKNLSNSTLKGRVCILAPNDPTARAIADVFMQDTDIENYVITGQDAELSSIKYIVNERQSMTVFKNTSTLAFDTMNIVSEIIKGVHVPTDATFDNGVKEVPGICTSVTVITNDNYYTELVSSGYYTDEQIRD